MKLGVRLESLELPFRRALLEAQRAGVAGVQFDAAGDLAPDALSQTGRREIRVRLQSHDLELAALGCDYVQGFLFSRPQPADVLDAWLRDNTFAARAA